MHKRKLKTFTSDCNFHALDDFRSYLLSCGIELRVLATIVHFIGNYDFCHVFKCNPSDRLLAKKPVLYSAVYY